MSQTYLVGHMKDEEFIPCDISTDMSKPQMHGVYVNPGKRFVVEVVGIFGPNMVMTTDLDDNDDPKLEAVEHLRDSLKEKLEEEE